MEEIKLEELHRVIGGAAQPNEQVSPRPTGEGNTGTSMWRGSDGGGVRVGRTMQFARDPVGAAKGPNGEQPRM